MYPLHHVLALELHRMRIEQALRTRRSVRPIRRARRSESTAPKSALGVRLQETN